MLFLLFQLGKERYALEASRVVEVIPLLTLKRLPQAPRGIAGLFNYRGRPVPALDLCEFLLGYPAAQRLSTRIIIVQPDAAPDGAWNPAGAAATPKQTTGTPRSVPLLGLIAENATEVVRKDVSQFAQPGLKMPDAPYLGPVLMDAQGSLQWIHEQRLLSEPVRDFLSASQLTT